MQTTLVRLRRVTELRRHWCNEERFSQTFISAMRAHAKRGAKTIDAAVSTFLDSVVARVVCHPRDLVTLCNMLDEERTSREFMRFYVSHELADHDVLLALVESPKLIELLPDDPQWLEIVVLLYGSAKLADSNGRKLTIDEIAPLGLHVERSVVRSLVGSAFDADLLADGDRTRLLTIFPDDPYFKFKLSGV